MLRPSADPRVIVMGTQRHGESGSGRLMPPDGAVEEVDNDRWEKEPRTDELTTRCPSEQGAGSEKLTRVGCRCSFLPIQCSGRWRLRNRWCNGCAGACGWIVCSRVDGCCSAVAAREHAGSEKSARWFLWVLMGTPQGCPPVIDRCSQILWHALGA
jgi:hypothetical protein